MTRRLLALGSIAAAAVLLAACGSSGPSSSPATSTTTTTSPPGTTTTVAQTVQNLVVTPTVRQSLLVAGAAHKQLAVSDFTGLAAGETYYAYDPATKTYWAGAALDPSSSSLPAQVSSQDDGSYEIYWMPAGGAWRVYDDGLAGIGGTPCPVAIPPGVRAAWHWAAACRPPGI
jgi:ABC-type Fe3+-hydroxamate transport system substrate-binding protein